MKKLLIFTLMAVCGNVAKTMAQALFGTTDSITINNFSTGVTVHGDMFCNAGTGGYIEKHCEFPKGSGKHVNLIGALWMSANDAGGQLHVAAQTFRQGQADYWPGPLEAGDTLTYATSYKWAKIWKVSRADIQAFQATGLHTIGNTLPAILTWPGKGNANAVGNGGYALTVTTDMAPFVDLNGNGVYEPLKGDYPDIKGDEALWWVFSDNGPAHTETNSRALGVEVHAMVYGYKRNAPIDNVLYYDYSIINRSPNNYSNFRAAIWDDADLGFHGDDYVGYDASHRMSIIYNESTIDGAAYGVPDWAYGANPPITGLSMVVLPGDAGSSYVPAGSLNEYRNDMSVVGNPTSASDYDNYMRAKVRNGNHITNTFGGAGMPCLPWGTGPECDFLYPGDPSDGTQWSECKCSNNGGDKQVILSSSDVALAAGGSAHVVLALMAIEHAGACGAVNFNGIKALADVAWSTYHSPLPPIPASVDQPVVSNVAIYPNPATGRLFIDGIGSGDAAIAIYNTIGQKMNIESYKSGGRYTVDISNFPPGMYYVKCTNDDMQNAASFVKE